MSIGGLLILFAVLLVLMPIAGLVVAFQHLVKSQWLEIKPAAISFTLYIACICMVYASRIIAWQRKIVVGAEKHEIGFFGGPDGEYYTPNYKGEDDWLWLLLPVPAAILIILYVVRRKNSRLIGKYFILLFPTYFILLLYGMLIGHWFDSPTAKPGFPTQELTSPSSY